MNAAKETFPDLAVDKQQQQHMETDSEEEKETETLDTLACLKNIFMGKKYCCTKMIRKFMCGSRGGIGGLDPPWKITCYIGYIFEITLKKTSAVF